MTPCKILQHACVFAMIVLTSTPLALAEQRQPNFREILEVAGLGPEMLAEFSTGSQLSDEDWRLLPQLLYRLQQHHSAEPNSWGDQPQDNLGRLFELSGIAESVERLPAPPELAEMHQLPALFRCQLRLDDPANSVVVLTAKIPRRWKLGDSLGEPVRVRGVLLRAPTGDPQRAALLLSQHLAWYPTTGVPTGQLLLASAGMDVSLLDDVVQRQDFVRAEVSREGEAFYACLAALGRVDQARIATLAKENVARVAERWKELQPALRQKHEALQAELAGADPSRRQPLQEEIAAARRQRGLAAAVVARAEQAQSSVAPLFLQPEEEVGELVRLEGMARRAVRIAAPDQPEVNEYFEVEIFTADSQNLPVTCCVDHLPPGFPTGDAIREPVRVVGVFFKSWRYRIRTVDDSPGETTRHSQLYTPVVLGVAPTWLAPAVQRESRWGLVGGIAFLGALIAVWVSLARLARRDRQTRAVLRHADKLEM